MRQGTARRQLRTHHGSGGWTVTAMECADGVARVECDRDVTEIVIGESSFGDLDPDCFAAAACTPDGDVLVVSRQAPPALLVTKDGKRSTPGGSEDRELLHLEEDELLLILSPALFETMPAALARTLHGSTDDLLQADPASLLADLFDGVSSGSGAIIGRDPQAQLTTGEHQ